MRAFQSLFLFSLPFASAVLAQEQRPQPATHNLPRELNEAFHELLDILPEESIQAALHKHFQQKYKAGVFQFNRKAVEAVHSTDAPLATRLVIDAAKHGLVRRQNNGTATTRPTNSPSPTPSPSPTVSLPIPITTTDSSGKPITRSSTVPGVIETMTNSAGSTLLTTKAAPTPEETTSVVVDSTTLPDGSLVFVTKTVINKNTPTKPADSSATHTTAAGLQNGAGRGATLAAGAIVVAAGTLMGALLV